MRTKATKKSFQSFLIEFLISEKFFRIFTTKTFTHFWNTLNRYRSNIN